MSEIAGPRVYDCVMDMLSNADNPTPLVRLNRVVPFAQMRVFAKLEWYNPFGAVKDRIAANLVRDAEDRSILGSGQKLVEPTSGNTGLGLAMIANAKHYPLRTPMSSSVPAEKRAALRFFGCDVLELDDNLCPAPGAPEGAIATAMSIAESESDCHMLNQYANEANPEAHYRTTGPEIWRQTQGRVTHLVAGLGTCGTISGAGRFLREQNPRVQLVGVCPEEGHDIPGVRSLRQLEQTRFFEPDRYNHVVEVANREAFDMCLRLNRQESIIAGPSSGMAVAGLLKVLEDVPDAVAVVIFPDNIFKYASSIHRHFPEMFPRQTQPANAREQKLLERLRALARDPANTVEADEARPLIDDRKTLFVDVRKPDQYQAGHVPGAINVELDKLEQAIGGDLPSDRDHPMVTVCNKGNSSLDGMLMLRSLRYTNVRSLNGGTSGWIERGYPAEAE